MRIIPALIFLSIAIAILGALHFYIWARLVRDAALPQPWYGFLTWIIILLGVSIPVAFVIGRRLPFETKRMILPVPYTWLGVILILVALLICWELFWILFRAGRFVAGNDGFDPERRMFFFRMASGIIGGTAGIETTAAILTANRTPVVNRFEVRLSKLPAELDGYTIAQITDLHIGLTLGRPLIEKVVELTNSVKPDLIAITGDLVDGFPDRLKHDIEPLSGLIASSGVFFVTGNHEYYSGVQEWIPEIEALGIRVLRNERVSVGKGQSSFDLVGVDDFSSRGMAEGHSHDLPRALSGRDPDRETVLLAHQPRSVLEASKYDVGLVLSGHTHGGQIWPWKYFVYLQQPYVSGLHQHGPRTQIYVSQGTGFWGPPMRLGTRGEIALITLRSDFVKT